MDERAADIVIIDAEYDDYNSSGATQFEEVRFLRVDDQVWYGGKHYVKTDTPDSVEEGDAFLFDAPGDVPAVWIIEEFDGEMAIMQGGAHVRIDTLTGDYEPSMGDPGPPPMLEERPLE